MIKQLTDITQQAGHLILNIYNQPSFAIMHKTDNSILTKADIASHTFIVTALQKLYPSIPVISEESDKQYNYHTRKNWQSFFLVDPLDGTKEFIKRNDEFTINIALVEKNAPILGIIHAPALRLTYYAEKNKGAYKIINNEHIKLLPRAKTHQQIRVIASRSHCCEKTNAFLKTLENQGKEIITTNMGSALKFGLLAEDRADIYPRFVPTMEWDTAAGQILINEVGKQIIPLNSNDPLTYNKTVLINPGFIAQ
jgi:3'(2'), 5'-bisphosphate nucleotidase